MLVKLNLSDFLHFLMEQKKLSIVYCWSHQNLSLLEPRSHLRCCYGTPLKLHAHLQNEHR